MVSRIGEFALREPWRPDVLKWRGQGTLNKAEQRVQKEGLGVESEAW